MMQATLKENTTSMLNACNYGSKGIMQACMIHSWVQKSFTLVSDTFKQIPIILHN